LDIGHWILDIEGVPRLISVLAMIAVLGFLTRFALKSNSLELVHVVVVNAVAQKAPDDYPRHRVYQAFSDCLEQVEERQDQDQYLQHLQTLSHSLEKVQYLESVEVDSLLEDLLCD